MKSERLRTRLAPSPTGALHLGNARTFLINWALARQNNWRILLRVEDLDTPRVKPGIIDATIDIVQWLGIDWDEGPVIQSHDLEPYHAAMRFLAAAALTYPSEHTRSQLEDLAASEAASAPQEGSQEVRFPADLRPPLASRAFDREDINWRFATPSAEVEFTDTFAGRQTFMPCETIGDFIVWTKRGQPAYQLAVVVDDARQSITHIVRGNDLLESAARQLLLYRALRRAPEPQYCHLPLVRGQDGRRLAKRHGDTRLDHYRARGVMPERVIGLIAAWSGVCPRPTPLSASEFAAGLRLDRIPPGDITFTPEDNAWLLQSR